MKGTAPSTCCSGNRSQPTPWEHREKRNSHRRMNSSSWRHGVCSSWHTTEDMYSGLPERPCTKTQNCSQTQRFCSSSPGKTADCALTAPLMRIRRLGIATTTARFNSTAYSHWNSLPTNSSSGFHMPADLAPRAWFSRQNTEGDNQYLAS